MSKLDELIQELCPDGVEYREIGSLIKNIVKTITPSIKIKKNDYKAIGKTPIISQEIEFISGYCDIEDKNIKQNKYVCFGDHSEHIKYVDFPFVQGADGLKILTTDESILNSKYFYYAISNFYIRYNNYQRHFKYLLETSIPVPPLAIQEEIVRILDKFTNATIELQKNIQAELKLRKKQYEYYRDALLTFEEGKEKTEKINNLIQELCSDGVEYLEIGNICKNIVSGGTPPVKHSEYYNGMIPWLRTQEVDWKEIYDTDIKITQEGYDNSSAKWIPKNCVIVAMYGATAAKAAINKIELTTNQACCNLNINEQIANYRYVYYCISKEYLTLKNLGQGSQNNINAGIIKSYKIPVPPLPIQEEIVRILDKFDTLCNDLSKGLPREIELRQKQYEYYRDKLLTFKVKER